MTKQFKEELIQVIVAMIEPKSDLFQVQQFKGVIGHTFKLLQVRLGETLKRLDAINVRGPLDKLVLAVAGAKMAIKAHVDQPIVPAPAVRVNYHRDIDFTANNDLQGIFQVIRDNFRVHLPAAFEQAKDDGFTARAAASFAVYQSSFRRVQSPRPTQPALGYTPASGGASVGK